MSEANQFVENGSLADIGITIILRAPVFLDSRIELINTVCAGDTGKTLSRNGSEPLDNK